MAVPKPHLPVKQAPQDMYNWGHALIVPNFLPPSECNALMQYMERYGDFSDSRTGADVGMETILEGEEKEQFDKNTKNPDIRACEVAWITPPDPSHYTNTIVQLCHQSMSGHSQSTLGYDTHRMEPLQYTKYTYHEDNEVKDHYDWHIDSYLHSRPTPFDRKVSMSLQLSDPKDYDGCGLHFQHPPNMTNMKGEVIAETYEDIYNIMKEQGTAVMFPSIYAHMVSPITRGTRCSLVGWLQGPKFR